MLSNAPGAVDPINPAIAELNRLRRFSGPPAEFWPAFLAAAAQLIQASRGILIVRDPSQPEKLKKLGDWSNNGQGDRATLAFNKILPELTDACCRQGQWIRQLDPQLAGDPRTFALGIALQLPGGRENCVAAFLVLHASEAETKESLVRLQLTADLPVAYQSNSTLVQAKADVEKFASVFDVMVLVNAEVRFRAAALALCNGLAGRFNCERVSLGWFIGGYIKLQTMSRTERFDPNMVAVKSLETAMDECYDQNDEIVWPAPQGFLRITKDHEAFVKAQGSGNILSLPVRVDDKVTGVMSAERQARAFSEVEINQFRLACDQAARRLAELQKADRWFGARWAGLAKEKLAKAVGPEHTWAKITAIGISLALVILCLPIFNYRVEGNFILRSEDVSFLTAPFDGYIQSVNVRPGDLISNAVPLVTLNTDDLLLEESSAVADANRFERESEKARAARQLAEMRISQALADQARARLEMVRYRLSRAAIKSPFNGVVIEGDLRQRIGAPVKQGDGLLKIGRIDSLYVEANIHERDVHEILHKSNGEIAFVSQPKLKFPVKVTRVEPAAFPKEHENDFVVRLAFASPVQPWWRPGMSGICKINVEKRTLLWILTHRTVDVVRIFLWW